MPHNNALRWKCRRGMLELDILLNNFLNTTYSKLNKQEQCIFKELLDQQDDNLFALLMGKISPRNQRIKHVIHRIQQATDSQS